MYGPRMKPSGWCLIAAVAATLVGILAPWAYGVYPDGTVATNTFSGTTFADGKIAMGLWAVLAGFSALTLAKRWLFAVVLADMAAFAIAVLAATDLADLQDRAAWGLWLLTVSSIATFIAVIVVRREVRREHDARSFQKARAAVVSTSQSDEEIARNWRR
jgi:hypothetical protein